jgi:hypothetical protein
MNYQVPAEAAEVIEIQTGHPVNRASLTINASLSGEAGDVAVEARSLREQAHRLTEQAGERTRRAVALLSQKGFTVRDIGALTGITYQRAQQLRKG